MKLFLEISSLGSACKKMPFEPFEKAILNGWARHDKNTVKEFLFTNNCIISSENETQDEMINEIYSKYSNNVKKTDDFKEIKEKVINECVINNFTPEQIQKAQTYVDVKLNQDCGKNNERELLRHKPEYRPGNSKMYYYKLPNGNTIGGLHDATKGDMVIEIKTRMKRENIRHNKYDLYQLFGYLLVLNKMRGKIVQVFNGEYFESDVYTDNEYGIIDITVGYWKDQLDTMLAELENYFNLLQSVLSNKSITEVTLNKAILQSERPIAIYNEGKYGSINPKYRKLIEHISKI